MKRKWLAYSVLVAASVLVLATLPRMDFESLEWWDDLAPLSYACIIMAMILLIRQSKKSGTKT